MFLLFLCCSVQELNFFESQVLLFTDSYSCSRMDQDSGVAVLAPFRDQLVFIYCTVFEHFSTTIDFSWIYFFFLFQVMTIFIVSKHIQVLFIFTECEIKNCWLFVYPQHGFPENETIGMLKEQFPEAVRTIQLSYRYVCLISMNRSTQLVPTF